MVSFGNINITLSKSLKDLADWSFPLYQTLVDYDALFKESSNINFVKAGLVIQNSANVYGRRVDCLHQIVQQKAEEIEKDNVAKERIKKSYVDFDNFVMIDMKKDIRIKSIDKKGQPHAQKKIKLLSRRFTQLETSMAHTCAPIKVYDVTGEVIGKKYNFQCNQAVNINRLLVDELTSYDFTCMLYSSNREDRNSISTYSEPKTPGTGTSGYHSFQADNDLSMLQDDIHDEFEDEHISSSIENITGNQLEFIGNSENTTNNYNDFSPVEDDNLNQLITETTQHTEENMELNVVKSSCNSSIESTKQVTDNEKEINNLNNNVEQFENYEQVKCNKRLSLKNNQKGECKRRIHCTSGLNQNLWKPMRMSEGVKKDYSKRTCVLEVPENIHLLDSELSKKRKCAPEDEPECLVKFMLRDKALDRLNDVPVPSKSNIQRLEKHELEDFMKNLDKCLNIETLKPSKRKDASGNKTSRCHQDAIENIQSEIVENMDMEQQDFHVSSNDQSENVENDENEIEDTRSRDVTPPSTIYENNTFERSPDSSDEWSESGSRVMNNSSYSLTNYESLIEEEINEICKDEDANELNQTVANWHEFVQPRLSDSESHAKFQIHEYTSSIIGALQESKQKDSTFDNIVQGKPPYEVARYFFAALQLANNRNVEISTIGDNIELKLLSDKMDQSELNNTI